jgi:hypothetical protein
MIFCNKCGGTLNASGLCLDCGAQAFPSGTVTQPQPPQVGESPDGFPVEPKAGPQSRSSFPPGLIVVLLAVLGILAVALLIYFAANSRSRSGSSNSSSNSGNPTPPVNNPPGLPDSFQRDYQGTISGQSFSVTLIRSGRNLRGTASTSRTDTLSGTIETDGSFRLDGYENGTNLTGIYTGQIHTDGTLTGNWTNPKGLKETPFYLRQQ